MRTFILISALLSASVALAAPLTDRQVGGSTFRFLEDVYCIVPTVDWTDSGVCSQFDGVPITYDENGRASEEVEGHSINIESVPAADPTQTAYQVVSSLASSPLGYLSELLTTLLSSIPFRLLMVYSQMP
jgi:hypothetical protein